jgi:hypothetical protein
MVVFKGPGCAQVRPMTCQTGSWLLGGKRQEAAASWPMALVAGADGFCSCQRQRVLCAQPGVLAHVLVGQSKGACWRCDSLPHGIPSALLTCCILKQQPYPSQLPHMHAPCVCPAVCCCWHGVCFCGCAPSGCQGQDTCWRSGPEACQGSTAHHAAATSLAPARAM